MKRTSLLIVSWLTLAVGSSSAQTSYWDPGNTGGTGSGGDGTWDTVTPNFSNGLAGGQVWNNGDNAVFGGAPGNVSLLGSLSAASLTFQANYNFNLAAGNSLAVTGTVDLGANTLTLAGAGPLQLGGTNGLVGSGTLAFNGGLLQVAGSGLTTNVNATFAANVYSTINTNGFASTWSGNLTGSQGGLVKTGSGDLALGGTNAVGSILVAGGSLSQATGSLTTAELAVGTGAGNTASFTMSGGTITFPAGPVPPLVGGPTAQSSFRVGDFGGTGTFDQTAGTINVSGSINVGNQGGTGTYNLSGGTLNLADGLYNLGRKANASTASASTGTLNLSGTGLVNVQNGAFIIGSRDNGALASTSNGTINQSGGTFRLSGTSLGDALYLSGYGNGTYNLTGGTLEVGGVALQGHYGPGAGTYAFNLGGGTIRVINAALNTSVNANLNPGVYSTVDTNGLGANWSGNFTGAQGGLIKTGAGDLALSGSANVIGSFKVTGGSVTQNSGALSSSEVSVGTDGGTGTYNFGGGTMTLVTGTPPPLVGGSASSLRVGDFNGTGAFNQTGGTINVSGSF
ncbi:MAG: hypothetical protein JSR82_14485, partial [Verrucomicrobia bacterium]|nr:hypothetical protein [Verrucomicrobiota bacterium]